MSTDPVSQPPAESTPAVPGTAPTTVLPREHEVPEMLSFLKENGLSALIGIGLAVAAFLGWSAWKNYKAGQTAAAATQLFQAQEPSQLQQVVDQYPSTPAAPLALLGLAGQQFDQGQFELAQTSYARFLQDFPEHALRLSAELGQIQCQEGLGQYEQAVEGYARFAEQQQDRYLRPVALLGKGRSLEQLGKLEEARAVYEDLLLAEPEGRWATRADAALKFVDMSIRARASGQPGSVPAPAPAPPIMLDPLAVPAAQP